MNIFHIQRDIMCSLAVFYQIDGNREAFRTYWELFRKALDYDKEHGSEAALRVADRIGAIKLICDRVATSSRPDTVTIRPWTAPVPGMQEPEVPDIPQLADHIKNQEPPLTVGSSAPRQYATTMEMVGVDGLGDVKRLPVAGSYVIFSDIHMTGADNRQNFFATENKALYLDVLKGYYAPGGFDLIENGDVEELLIYEPVLKEISDIKDWAWSEIFDYRDRKKEENIRSCSADNKDYYEVIHDLFAAKGRYHKIVGNHDVCLMNAKKMNLLREATGYDDLPDPVETVLLSDDTRHHFFICHGHQFDHSCTPGFAGYLGESYTQAAAWAFQGPDRSWRFKQDWLDDMLSGDRSVYNDIVGTEPTGLTDGQVLAMSTAFGLGAVASATFGAPLMAALAAGTLSAGMVQQIFAVVPPKNLLEWIMNKNIAWEYFDDPDHYQKLAEELTTTGRLFKVRHTEEIALTDFLANEVKYNDGEGHWLKPWSDAPAPTVVIGHSHEARINSRRPNGTTAKNYINTSAAGRFANLIWGLEIVDGEPRLFTWHNDGKEPVRTTWEAFSPELPGIGPALVPSLLRPVRQESMADLAVELPAAMADDTNFKIAALAF